MRRALGILSVIAGIIVVVVIIGYLLPEGHTATASRPFAAPPAEVWRLVTGVEQFPRWRSTVTGVERLSGPGEPLRWLETWKRGDEMPFRETERVEQKRLVVVIDSNELPFGGSWTYELQADGDTTQVTITENGEVHNPVFRLVSHFFMDPTNTMNVYLDDLGAALSTPAGAAALPGLDRLVSWMTGSFSSEAQAAADSSYFDIRLEMVPIWVRRDDGRWLYVEQASASQLDAPYRQRVYRLTEPQPGVYASDVFTITSPLRFAGSWKTPGDFDALAPDSLSAREGCTVWLSRDGDRFTGQTRGRDCESTLRGAAYATSEVTITADAITTWDRGFDAGGNQVWGAEDGAYEFRRKP